MFLFRQTIPWKAKVFLSQLEERECQEILQIQPHRTKQFNCKDDICLCNLPLVCHSCSAELVIFVHVFTKRRVSVNKESFKWSISVNKELLTGTVTVNSTSKRRDYFVRSSSQTTNFLAKKGKQ